MSANSNKPDSMETLYRKRDRALERVIARYKKDKGEVDNEALDALTLAHTAVTFKFVGG